MKVSTRGDYASRALLSLALHADASGEGTPTAVRDIAERTGLPQPYLEQILLALKGAGLVRSKRGVGGGYVLARLERTRPAPFRASRICSRYGWGSPVRSAMSRTAVGLPSPSAAACSANDRSARLA